MTIWVFTLYMHVHLYIIYTLYTCHIIYGKSINMCMCLISTCKYILGSFCRHLDPLSDATMMMHVFNFYGILYYIKYQQRIIFDY